MTHSPSALELVLLVPQRVVEVEDTLIERAAAGIETHIGAGETRLPSIILLGARDAIRSEQGGKGEN
jgi:hypothetical protein